MFVAMTTEAVSSPAGSLFASCADHLINLPDRQPLCALVSRLLANHPENFGLWCRTPHVIANAKQDSLRSAALLDDKRSTLFFNPA
jgi:hypothetical protein